jgi:hypothetical protein
MAPPCGDAPSATTEMASVILREGERFPPLPGWYRALCPELSALHQIFVSDFKRGFVGFVCIDAAPAAMRPI